MWAMVKKIYIYIKKLEVCNTRDRDGENGGGWRDTESLVKVKPDSLRVVMEAG